MARHSRPRVGINTDFVPAGKTGTAHARLNSCYFDAVVAGGGLPVLLPPINLEDELDALLDLVDGVLLCGGLDMDPRRNGQPPHPAVVPMAKRREDNDRLLVRRVVDRHTPVLGIALGMHQLTVLLGGSLHLHLPDDLPKALPHKDYNGGGPHRHGVLIQPKTRLHEIYGDVELRVNSSHHQAVKSIGPGMRVGAKAPDGVIEAVETTDPDWFCVGVQWHPEAETASALDGQLFDAFVQACAGTAGAARKSA